ncbi:hypothetical protein FSARC_490 [Fusarium sarcochroum]|uniref:Nitroreductase domain-containing protein n=1 Tax=Fusarium sarcochroum TaxID=1208366 RepID=A0A8H4UB18_9HYPO|nr:hypothetical protein FSARC_490 [Fusarium sarcochroum]
MGSVVDTEQVDLIQQRYEETLPEGIKLPWNSTVSLLLEHISSAKATSLLSGDQQFIREAPLFILFRADVSRLHDASDHHRRPGNKVGLERIDSFIMSTLDAAMTAQNAAVAAESLGLGICYAGGAQNNACELTDYFELPSHVVGLFSMAVGKPNPET